MHFLKSSDIRIKSEHFQKPVNYRLALLSEFLSPALRVFARLLVPSATSPYTWRKGLLIGSNHIGDILYRSSSLPELAKAFPNCQWHIVAPPPADQLLENNPNIAGVIRQFEQIRLHLVALNRSTSFSSERRNFKNDLSWNLHVCAIPSSRR